MTDASQKLPQTAPRPQEAAREVRFRNSVSDWAIRAVIFIVFLYFGTAKLKADPSAPWVVLFDRIGMGQWLRSFAGVVESLGAFLVLVSRTVEIGLGILITTMFAATIITIFILHHPADAFVPIALLSGMVAFWLHRRRV